MADSTGILDLIDSAIEDWTVSGDAMRCGADPETSGASEFGVPQSLRPPGFGPTFAEAMEALRVAFQRFGEQVIEAFEVFKTLPHWLSYGYPPCACHPAPNPAARDYRRRTKHRNRRRA